MNSSSPLRPFAARPSRTSRARRGLGLALLLAACGSEDPSRRPAGRTAPPATDARGAARDAGAPAPQAPDAGATPQADAPFDPALREHASDVVFADDRVSTWALTFAPEDLARLEATALEKKYVPARLAVDGVEVGTIGVRHKGQYSLNVFCSKDGKLTCKKVSYKLDFAEYDANQRFHKLKHVALHSQNEDATRLHERLAYKLFRQMGVPAPRATHARVLVNGAYRGLFGLIEVIDGRFTDRWFPKGGNGNLYKEAWPVSESPKDYEGRQKTNEGEVPPTKIAEAARAFRTARPAELAGLVSSWFDVDALLPLVVVDRAVNAWDDFLAFYCNGAKGPCPGNHNFYIYESPDAKRLHLLPWDMDKTFARIEPMDAVSPWNAPATVCD
jgi:spore coat protein CotH